MALHLLNLNEEGVRLAMLREITQDQTQERLYVGKYLSATGAERYPELLKQAAGSADDALLALNLRHSGTFLESVPKRTPTGKMTIAKVPVTAADTLAEGEFNRFYMRGLCLVAMERGITELEVYRARHSEKPRAESEALIGKRVLVAQLLEDLRTHPGCDTALGLPPGPNSGLSVRIP
ncbi:MAG TPA: hypothetical protein VF911_11580 [Thermoanaerobaculia bacterium]|jgi:hypothetical protein